MVRRKLTALMSAIFVMAACSGAPRLAPPPDISPEIAAPPEPQVYASGTMMGGAGFDMAIQWDLEEIIGFSHAVSLTAETPTSISVRSASPQGATDAMWLVGTTLTPNGPTVVFGGVQGTVDSIVVRNELGQELALELIEIPDDDWQVTLQEIPSEWQLADGEGYQVIASGAGIEIAREELPGLGA